MTDYIVAIDFGTSHITGIVGEKNTDGTFSIIACETENPASCIHRGNIYNVENTAGCVKNLIKKLEQNLKGSFIDKVYVGVGGQSLRIIEHVERKEIKAGQVVSEDDIRSMQEKCEKYKPDKADVLYIVPPVYFVNERQEVKPVGVSCKEVGKPNLLEAKYKIVVGRPSIRMDIDKSIKDRCKKEVAGIIVSPLALADAMLNEEEKTLGCALVDFGAGVTSVAVYKGGNLLQLSVIPFGGNLITRDITSLQVTEAVAENLKIVNGSALPNKEDDDKTVKVWMEGGDKEISINDLNTIIEGRAKEITENVYARISEAITLKSLGSGIVLAGCASGLKGLEEMLKERCKINIRNSAIRDGLVRGYDNMIGNPLYMQAVSLMLKGTQSCVSQPFVKEVDINVNTDSETVEDTKTESGGFFRRRKKENKPKESKPEPIVEKETDKKKTGLGDFFGDIFKEN